MAGGLDVKIVQFFLEEAEFRHRAGHLELPETQRPANAEIEVETGVGVSDDEERAIYRLTIDNTKDKDALYDVRVVLVGMFEKPAEVKMDLWAFVATNGLTLLYPFIREAVANLTSRGRFGPVWLAPIDVRAVTNSLLRKRGEDTEKRVSQAQGVKLDE